MTHASAPHAASEPPALRTAPEADPPHELGLESSASSTKAAPVASTAPEASEVKPLSAPHRAPAASSPRAVADTDTHVGANPSEKHRAKSTAPRKISGQQVASLTPLSGASRVRDLLKDRSSGGARLALVIDDIGMSVGQLQPFLDLDADLSFAIIPETRQAVRCLELIRANGHEALLHLPMEPFQHTNLLPPGSITTDLSDAEITRRVEKDLDELPGVRGVNNHMGSKATQDERVMSRVLSAVQSRGLFFLDSKTMPDTVVGTVAHRLAVPHAARSGEFLDDGGVTRRARSILLALGREAVREGSAIAIGHPHPGTARAIAQALPELKAMGVRIVPVSDLTRE